MLHNAHLSILPDSTNVYASFDELEALQVFDPDRYGAIALTGTILADPSYATEARLAHPQVKGIRVVLHDTPPGEIADDLCVGPEWAALFDRLRPDRHLHIYAKDPRANLIILRRLPDHVPLMVDHLGTCYPERGDTDPDYIGLIAAVRARGNTVFKGPGYRTSLRAEAALPFLMRILDLLGPQPDLRNTHCRHR